MKLTAGLLQFLLPLLIGLIPIILLIYGYLGYQQILLKNPCGMTYSYPFQYESKYEWKNEQFRLLKVSASEGASLNKHPVLFVPGHHGSHKQVRSFASETHNEDKFFQYFAVDFHQDIVGLHGKDILLKAAFVNEALRVIRKLYTKPDQKITLLGHSYGGMIAKTSILLSNHPNCVVDSIFMLGTPNTKPAHGIDASLTTLYNQVNKAYYSAFYANSSCGNYNVSSRYSTSKVNFAPTCTACLRNITLVSVSGGELDFEVLPQATNIYDMSARPRNVTSLPVNKKGIFSFSRILSTITDVRRTAFNTVYTTIFGTTKPTLPVSDFEGNNSSINGTSSQIVHEEEGKVPENSTYSFITRDLWDETILPYHEPRHTCIRSSQILGVGFPIDHYALLWCRELLAEITFAMRKVVRNKDIALRQLFDLRDLDEIKSVTAEVQSLKISELSSFVERNISNILWQRAARIDEKFMYDAIQKNSFQFFAVFFFLRHWQDILSSFLGLVIFALSMKVIAIITALDNRVYADSYFKDIELLVIVSKKVYKILNDHNLFYILFGGFSIGLYYLRKLLWINNFQTTLIWVIYWILSLIAGFFLRTLLIAGIRVFRFGLNLLRGRGRKKAEVEVNHEGGSSKKNFIQRMFGKCVWRYLNELNILLVWGSVFIVYHWYDEVPTSWALFISSWSVVFYAAVFVEFLYISVVQSKNHIYAKKGGQTSPEYVDEEILLILLWLLIAAIPSFKFCVEITFLKPTLKFETALYDSLIPDHIQYLLLLFAAHLFLRKLASKKQTIKIQPMASLLTLLEKPLRQTSCVHEDGGVNSIFEEVANDNVRVGNHVVSVGTTYRVVWCNCKENRNFKTTDEWCEWCKCSKCNPAGSNAYSANQDGKKFTLNLDLALGVVLLAISMYVLFVIHDEVYTGLYSAAYAVSAMVARSFVNKRTIELSL